MMRKSVFLTLLVALFSIATVEVKGAELNSKAGDYLPQAGDYIMLQNRQYETWLGIHSWEMLYGAEKTVDLDPNLIWELQEVASAEGKYNLYNVGLKKYAVPLTGWDGYCWAKDNVDEAGEYQLVQVEESYVAIYDPNVQTSVPNGNYYMYHSEWDPAPMISGPITSEASHWIITEVCPLNVTYKRGDEVFAEYGIETFVSAGEIHILDDKGMEIESCVVNGQPIEKTDGVWSIVINKATTIIVEFEDDGDEGDDDEDVEPSLVPVVNLINRIGGENAASKFKFVLDPALAVDGMETFVLGSEGSKVLIKGSTLSAITTGIGWYLNNVAHINIAWNSLNEATGAYVTLPSPLPLPAEETHSSDAQYRYYLNYCTFGYSMSTWTWERWQKEIDWMALHGVNMPLQIVGLEVVWRNFLMQKCNYSEAAAESFIAGPSFTPWWAMNNLEGWGGTTNDAWFARQENLAKQILARQRALGMEPVLPGFSGMMPSTDGQNGGNWCNFTRPQIISPTAENFETLAAAYYACLEE